jgi:hypothetical protein
MIAGDVSKGGWRGFQTFVIRVTPFSLCSCRERMFFFALLFYFSV